MPRFKSIGGEWVPDSDEKVNDAASVEKSAASGETTAAVPVTEAPATPVSKKVEKDVKGKDKGGKKNA